MRSYFRLISIMLVLSVVLFPSMGKAGKTAFHEDPDAVEKAALSVLMLTVFDSKGQVFATGSGFVMFDNRTLVTNYHVIEDAYSIWAESDDGFEYELTEVLIASNVKDIAILRFRTPTVMQPLIPATTQPRRLEHVVAIGSPKGQKNTVSTGNVSSLFSEDGVDYVQFTAPISSGSSGGAVFNDQGEVIGISSAAFKDAQNLNLAISISEVLALYSRWDGASHYAIKDYRRANSSTQNGSAAPRPTSTPRSSSPKTTAIPGLPPTQTPNKTPKTTPTPRPRATATPKPTATPAPTPPVHAEIKDANKGNIVSFGKYEQDNNLNNGKEEIEWIVLDKQGTRLLLISKYVLDAQPYHTKSEKVTWEKCSLRDWLNSTFLKEAFSKAEQKLIVRPKQTIGGAKGYDTSHDKVFLLNISEASKYFASNDERKCSGTAYACAQGRSVYGRGYNCWWWLRSPGNGQKNAAYIGTSGDIDYSGNYIVNVGSNIRPAIWIDVG